jgi:hypothetical protein
MSLIACAPDASNVLDAAAPDAPRAPEFQIGDVRLVAHLGGDRPAIPEPNR